MDLATFEDLIVSFSLCGTAVMRFRPAKPDCPRGLGGGAARAPPPRSLPQADHPGETAQKWRLHADTRGVDVLLEPGDLLVLFDEARYAWTHGIDEGTCHEYGGRAIARTLRVSVTARRMRPEHPWARVQSGQRPTAEAAKRKEDVEYICD